MSRHRNVRSMNYDEEYYEYDDVYGHSVEDDYATSPSVAQFMYDRDQATQMSAYLRTEEDIQEENEDDLDEEMQGPGSRETSVNIPPLGDMEKAQLYSCLDVIRDRLGETCSEQSAVDAVLASNFDVDKAVNALLFKASQKTAPPRREVPAIVKDNRPNINSSSLMGKPSLSQLANLRLSASGPKPSNTVLSKLASNHLTKTQASTETIPAESVPKLTKPTLAQLARINFTKPGVQSDVKALERETEKLCLNKTVQRQPRASTKTPSPLARVICSSDTGSIRSQTAVRKLQPSFNSSISSFLFTTPSPDDMIQQNLGLAHKNSVTSN